MKRSNRDHSIAVIRRDVMCLRGWRAAAVQRAKRAAAHMVLTSEWLEWKDGGWGVDKEPGSLRMASSLAY